MAFHSNGFASTTSASSPISPNPAMEHRFPQHVLSASLTSFSSPASARHSSHGRMNKTYKQASNLFLTRRYPEALSTVLPMITPPHGEPDGDPPADREGDDLEHPDRNGYLEPAPVATASRPMRVKVWCLYLTLLNAIVEMEPDQGKDAFGSQWRMLCSKVKEGDIWEEVVKNGYHGVEGDVDSDVVISLATLLLAHARSQVLNQKRLEGYLAACTVPNLDLSRRLSGSITPRARSTSSRRHLSPAKRPGTAGAAASGTDTPRDLASRVKILELYTLHVLRKNREWACAREFIAASPFLDEERRDAFLTALQSLQEIDKDEEKERARREEEAERETQERVRREVEEARRQRDEDDAREKRRLREEEDQRRSRSSRHSRGQGSEVDYGIDGPLGGGSAKGGSSRGGKAPPRRGEGSPRPALSKTGRKSTGGGRGEVVPTLGDRAAMVMRRLQGVIDQLSRSFQATPLSMMKVVSFVIMLLLMFSRKDLRARIQHIVATSWAKVRATAGMGVKVSYI